MSCQGSPAPPRRIALTVYFHTGYRSARDVTKHGVAAVVVLGLVAFVAYDMRHAALAYLDRVVVLNLPRGAQCEFRLRVAADPSHSEQFGPWHLTDHVELANGLAEASAHDAYAIRNRAQ